MFCRKCGKELNEGQNFCPFCGASQQDDVQQPASEQQKTKSDQNGVLSIIGFVLAMVGLCTTCVYYISFFLNIGAVVCCALALRHKDAYRGLAKAGLIVGIICLVLSVISVIVDLLITFGMLAGMGSFFDSLMELIRDLESI